MARGDSRLGMWRVALLTTAMVLTTTPLCAHGRHSLAGRRHHHHHNNQSSVGVEKEATATLSDDSAERDHLIGLGAGLPDHLGAGLPDHLGAGLPDHLGAGLPDQDHLGAGHHHRSHKHASRVDFEEPAAATALGEELTAGGGGAGPVDLQPGGGGDRALSDDDIVAVAFHSPAPDTVPSDDPADWPKVPVPQKQRAGGGGGGGDPTAWTLSDFYDYLAPDDDLSALDTTPEPEPEPSAPPPATEEEEDENPLLAGSPDNTKAASGPVGGGDSAGGGGGGSSRPVPPPPGRTNKGQGLGGALGPDGCRLGLVRSAGSGVCVSQCDADPQFCFNGGVCTAVAGVGAFCRCNVQEYIWNKGLRCDWMVTEFQVMCALVGVATVVLLLLFMIIVFFSKRLHRLKTQNRRLRKRSKLRPQSGEPQTDGMSLSTTADGSQPNVRKLCDTPPPPPQAHAHNLAYYDNIICQRPTSSSYIWSYKPRNPYNHHHQDDPQKQHHQQEEEPVKTPTAKEEESMNIRNSHSPKQENNRPLSVNMDHAHSPGSHAHTPAGHTPTEEEEDDEAGVTIDLELLLPQEAKPRPQSGLPLQYDVFLYKLDGDSAPNPSHPAPKSPKTPKTPTKSPKSPKSPKKAPKSPKSPNKAPKSPKSPKQRGAHNHSPKAPARNSSPGRHSVNGCYSAPRRHPSPRRSASQHHRGDPGPSPITPPPQLRRPRGRSPPPQRRRSGGGGGGVVTVVAKACVMRPSPSSPHLPPQQSPPPSPSRVRFGHVSTRSLPPLY